MTHYLLALMLAIAPPPKVNQAQVIAALQQQVDDQQKQIATLQQQIKGYQNKLYEVQSQNNQLRFTMYGPDGRIVEPLGGDSNPSCPVDGFVLQWFVIENPAKYSSTFEYIEEAESSEQTTHIEQPKSYEFKQMCVKKSK